MPKKLGSARNLTDCTVVSGIVKAGSGASKLISGQKFLATLLTDYTKGIFQSIGFKEFDAYLKLPEEERKTEKGQALLKQAVEDLKTVTKRYAKKQNRWIMNRLIRRVDRQVPSIYTLDCTDLEQWDTRVLDPASAIVSAVLRGEKPEQRPFNENVEYGKNTDSSNEEVYYCEICVRNFVGDHQWTAHINGVKHMKVVRRKKKLESERQAKEAAKETENAKTTSTAKEDRPMETTGKTDEEDAINVIKTTGTTDERSKIDIETLVQQSRSRSIHNNDEGSGSKRSGARLPETRETPQKRISKKQRSLHSRVGLLGNSADGIRGERENLGALERQRPREARRCEGLAEAGEEAEEEGGSPGERGRLGSAPRDGDALPGAGRRAGGSLKDDAVAATWGANLNRAPARLGPSERVPAIRHADRHRQPLPRRPALLEESLSDRSPPTCLPLAGGSQVGGGEGEKSRRKRQVSGRDPSHRSCEPRPIFRAVFHGSALSEDGPWPLPGLWRPKEDLNHPPRPMGSDSTCGPDRCC
ncbi:hypothetical protein KM043_012113 [Ampulex compressa]|nr:hypothetical protein KM043_012113 [Ampulex compressa]